MYDWLWERKNRHFYNFLPTDDECSNFKKISILLVWYILKINIIYSLLAIFSATQAKKNLKQMSLLSETFCFFRRKKKYLSLSTTLSEILTKLRVCYLINPFCPSGNSLFKVFPAINNRYGNDDTYLSLQKIWKTDVCL